MKKALLFLLVLSGFNLYALEGDVEIIRVHDAVDITWYGNYDVEASFPDGLKSYEKILMHYTLGCASTGCSDWDYTTQIHLMDPTGMMDSTIASLDTLSTEPLVVDTTWNVFEVLEPYELGRVITPYGGYMATSQQGYDNNWTHTHTFDVTDFYHLLKDNALIRAHYSGWSSGFSVTLDFEFVEGTPARKVHSVQNIYKGSSGYQTTSQFEDEYLYEKQIVMPDNMSGAKIRVIPTGHGFDNNTNCAEFCQKKYYIKIDGQQEFEQSIWRDDCGMNPVYPQAGTWIYDRANWCPGTRAYTFEHEITPFVVPGLPADIDMDIQNITWSGAQAPSYIISCQLIIYETDLAEIDLAVSNIIAPTNKDEFARINPITRNPIIEIENRGQTPITRTLIKYGVINADGDEWYNYQEWTGNLETFDKAEVEITGGVQWGEIDTENPVFFAEVLEMNYYFDYYRLNNYMETNFNIPDSYDEPLIFRLKTNNAPSQTTYSIVDQYGLTVHENPTLTANTTYDFDMSDLSQGHYRLTVNDSGEDGLYFPWGNQGTGFLRLLNANDESTVKSWSNNFGTAIVYDFTIGYSLGEQMEAGVFSIDITNPNLVDTLEQINYNPPTSIVLPHPIDEIAVGPNPTSDFINVIVPSTIKTVVKVFNINGQQLSTEIINRNTSIELPYSNGLYFIQIIHQGKTKTRPITISK